ncbi:MAG: hypothetical protein IK026_01755 [Eubacteriaceae bacterium]|nr:hypothetical protein [Eubacteriaceae bacterium]MBR5995297.1 hypothetical protein [Eubacteriaceae bacterium]
MEKLDPSLTKEEQEKLDKINFAKWNKVRIICAVITFAMMGFWLLNTFVLHIYTVPYFIASYGTFVIAGYMTWVAKQNMMKLDDEYAEKNGYFEENPYTRHYPKEERRRREAEERAKKEAKKKAMEKYRK